MSIRLHASNYLRIITIIILHVCLKMNRPNAVSKLYSLFYELQLSLLKFLHKCRLTDMYCCVFIERKELKVESMKIVFFDLNFLLISQYSRPRNF